MKFRSEAIKNTLKIRKAKFRIYKLRQSAHEMGNTDYARGIIMACNDLEGVLNGRKLTKERPSR